MERNLVADSQSVILFVVHCSESPPSGGIDAFLFVLQQLMTDWLIVQIKVIHLVIEAPLFVAGETLYSMDFSVIGVVHVVYV